MSTTKIKRNGNAKWELNGRKIELETLTHHETNHLKQKVEAFIQQQEIRVTELEEALVNSKNKLYMLKEMLGEVETYVLKTSETLLVYNTTYTDVSVEVPSKIALDMIAGGGWSLKSEKVSNYIYNEGNVIGVL